MAQSRMIAEFFVFRCLHPRLESAVEMGLMWA
jgi:hypothetical protein